jgi:hypothetical protein
MTNRIDSSPLRSEEEIRNARLARGLRAVAATVIVGGIVIAALETQAPQSHPVPSAGLVEENASGLPAVPAELPAAAPAAAPAETDPALRRLDRAMEHHG